MLTTCYSYIRWSSQKQSKGDTLRRQTDLASQWVATHPGHILDSSTYRDMGLSAFHGQMPP